MTKKEKQLLGKVLLHGDIRMITRLIFPSRNARIIYRAMMHLYLNGIPLDHVTIGSELKDRGQLDEIGGAIALADLTDEDEV